MKILVFAAHPDDVEPQMGGTILKHVANGDSVSIIQVTSPLVNGDKHIRQSEARQAARVLQSEIEFLDINSMQLHDFRKLVSIFDNILDAKQPERVYTCWPHDSHQEHTIVSNMVLSATRKNFCDVLFFEPIIPGGIMPVGFEPNLFIDISDFVQLKEESIQKHESQIQRFGIQWLEAIRSRSILHGFKIHKRHAEAFKIIKMIQ